LSISPLPESYANCLSSKNSPNFGREYASENIWKQWTFSVAVQEMQTGSWEREQIACNVVVPLLQASLTTNRGIGCDLTGTERLE